MVKSHIKVPFTPPPELPGNYSVINDECAILKYVKRRNIKRLHFILLLSFTLLKLLGDHSQRLNYLCHTHTGFSIARLMPLRNWTENSHHTFIAL